MIASHKIRMSRRVSFSSSHVYKVEAWSEQKNHEVFGACVHPHGHNYVLEAFFEGDIDPKTGMVMNLTEVDERLKKITGPLDHHDLNSFLKGVPTTENLAQYLWDKVGSAFAQTGLQVYRVRVFETDDLWVEVEA